jgi:hypothetical protein
MVQLYCALVVLLATILVSIEALSTTTTSNLQKLEASDTLVSATTERHDNLSKRILRGADSTTDDAATEERGFQASLLSKLSKLSTKARLPKTAKNLQFRAWLKGGKDPKAVYKQLNLAGKEPALVKKDPNFLMWLEYSKIWRDRGGRYMTRV